MTIPQKIREALDYYNGSALNIQVRQYILERWPSENIDSITASIITLTVNHESRVHYPVNKKPRITNTRSPYDFLYRTSRGRLEKYNIAAHGVWAIEHDNSGNLYIRLTEPPLIYTPGDIKWIKNVSNTETGQAYLNIVESEFVLHFPTKHKGNVLSPVVGEIIVLYQNINYTAVFTHLVTPVDNELITDLSRSDYRYGRKVQIIAMAKINTAINIKDTLWKRVKFNGISQGNACRIDNISGQKNIDDLQMDLWRQFADLFVSESLESLIVTDSVIRELQEIDPDFCVTEGGQQMVTHVVKERDRSIVLAKKAQALKDNKLFCEVCTFSFQAVYSANYIECHHLVLIGEPSVGERVTRLEDLALVCANCHRMLHTKINNRYLTIPELKDHIKNLVIQMR